MRALLYDPERLVAYLDEAGLDALILATQPNILYVTRYRKPGPTLAIVDRSRPLNPMLVLPASDIDFLVEDIADGVEVAAYGTFFRYRDAEASLRPAEELVERVHAEARRDYHQFTLAAELLEGRGLGGARIGTDVPLAFLASLAERIPHASLVCVPALIRAVRMVKTAEEIARLAGCAQMAEAAIEETIAHARPGVTQRALAAVFNCALAARSGRTRLDNVSIGTSSALGNVNVPDDVLQPGAIIRFDVGATYEGYCSDLSRCYALEPVSPKVADYHRALVQGQQAALDALRPGVRVCDLFSIAVAAVREAGIPHYDRTNVGHGIGIAGDGYDAPMLAPNDETAAEVGMVFCVEAPYYEIGFGGLQVEDMVVVRESGFESLCHLPRELRTVA